MAKGPNIGHLNAFRDFARSVYSSVHDFKSSHDKSKKSMLLDKVKEAIHSRILNDIDPKIKDLALASDLESHLLEPRNEAHSPAKDLCSTVFAESMEYLLVALDGLFRCRPRKEPIARLLSDIRTQLFDFLDHNIHLANLHQNWFSERLNTWIEKGAHVNGFKGSFHKNIRNRLIFFCESSEHKAASIRRAERLRTV